MPNRTSPSEERFGGKSGITPAMEDYLKAIYQIEQDGLAASTTRLSDVLELSGASVSNMVKRLNDLNLLVHNPYRGVTLTDAGNAVALEVIRHHRLLELFLSQALGFGIDQVHKEAERLEHHVSEEFEARMEAALGYPDFDPHGHPIPSRSGTLPRVADVELADLAKGTSGTVTSVSDRDQDELRAINERGIRPTVHIRIIDRNEDGFTIDVEGRPVAISTLTATHIRLVEDVETTS